MAGESIINLISFEDAPAGNRRVLHCFKLFKKFFSVLAVFCIIFTFTTCQTAKAIFQQPVVSLHSVELAGINFTGAQLLCRLQVENPNGFEIPFPEVGWELFINTNSFVSGIVKNNQRISARNTTLVDVPVNLQFLEILNTFTSFKGRKDIDYKVALAVKFPIPVLGDLVWNLAPEGVIPLPQIPKLSMPSITVGKADLSMVEMVVSVNVENPNAFQLPPPKVGFDYKVNNTSILRNTHENKASLAPSSVTPVAFALGIYYADLLRIFPGLLTSNNVPSVLDLSFDFGVPAFGGDNFNLQIPGSIPMPGRF